MYCASSPCEVENDVYTTIRDVTAKDNNILLYEVIGSKNVLKTFKPIFVVLFRFFGGTHFEEGTLLTFMYPDKTSSEHQTKSMAIIDLILCMLFCN